MKSKWATRPLGELVRFSSGGTPSKKRADYWKGNIPWISAKTLKNERITTSDLFISEDGLNAGSRIAPRGSILLLTRGSGLFNDIPIGLVEREVAFNQDIKCLDSCSEVENKYIFYWLISLKKYLMAKVDVTGIGAGKFDLDFLQKLEVPIPNKQERAQIVAFIDALSDKIELNRRINDNLQQQVFTIFQAEYQHPKENETWQNGCIGDVVNLQRGFDLPRDKVVNGIYPVAGSTGTIAYHSVFTTEPPCIVMGRSGNIGNPRLYLQRCWAHNTTLFSKEYKNSNPYWVYAMLKSIDYRQFQGGSAVPTLNRNHVHAFPIDIPPKTKQDEFGEFASEIFHMITKNDEENKKLCSIRDALLPKLMSGEIDVRSVNN